MSFDLVTNKPRQSVPQPEGSPRFNTAQFSDRIRAKDFVWQYIPSFCIYCPLTTQIYLDFDLYNIENDKGVVVLPRNHLSSIYGVLNNAISPTTLMLVPNNKLSRAQLLDRRTRGQSVSAQAGLIDLATANDFLPVVLKSDLKRLKSDVPFLMLRSIQLPKLNSISQLDRYQIRTTVFQKLADSVNQWGW